MTLIFLLYFIQIQAVLTQSKPNIVLIIVDDMRFDEFGAGGHSFLETPNIDRLARQGIVFTRAYHAVPLCSPNRASIMTGQYPSRHGILDNTSRSHASRLLNLFPKELRKSGYRTAHIGKWHMGNDPLPRPGYDYWVSFKGQGKTYDPEVWIQDTLVQMEGYITDVFTEKTLDFISKSANAGTPFFVSLAHKAIHPEAVQRDDGTVDMSVPSEFIPANRHVGKYNGKTIVRNPNVPEVPVAGKGKPVVEKAFSLRSKIIEENPEWLKILDLGVSDHTIQKRAEMMLAVDESVGRIANTLKELNIHEETVIIFTSDNGYFYGEHGFSVERRMPYEESIKTPLIYYYPGFQRQGLEIESLVLSIDIAPTILELAGTDISKTIQGKSVLGLINGDMDKFRETALIEFYSHENPFPWTANLDYRVVLKGNFKYIRWLRFDNQAELYDLQLDPYEQNNLINEPELKGKISELESELRRLTIEAIGLN